MTLRTKIRWLLTALAALCFLLLAPHGVSIQGLNQKLEEETKAKDEEIRGLKQRIDRLEQLLSIRSR